MKENTNVAPIMPAADAPAPVKRVQSEETLLKLELRTINRELDAIDKQIQDYEAATKAIGTVKDGKEKLEDALEAVKNKLIDVMGLR